MPATRAHQDQPQEMQDKVKLVMLTFNEMRGVRTNFEGHWNDIAHFVWPEMRNTFHPEGGPKETQGVKKTARQLDATPQIALNQFAAILDSLLTPTTNVWHEIKSDNEHINNDREATLWFQALNRELFRQRYAPTANFASQNQLQYKGLGAWGTGMMFVDGQTDGRGLRYKNIFIGEIYVRENHQGVIDTACRYYSIPGYKVTKMFKEHELPTDLWNDASDHPERLFEFITMYEPNLQLDPGRQDFRGKAWSSITISVNRNWLVREGGYHTFPFAGSRYEQAPNEIYGRSPAMMALPAIRTLQSEKSVMLKQGHRAVDPVLLTHDEGVLDGFSLTPGAANPGGVTHDGKLLVQTLPVGDVNLGLEMMDQERSIINSAFLVNLFELLMDTPRMTATEVIERVSQRGILLAPTLGRQQSEYLGPLVDREIDVLTDQGLVGPMPEILKEARGEYTLAYNNPLSRTMRAEEAAGIIRTLESVLPIIQTTGDPAPLDNFDMDTITRDVSEIQAVPRHWMNSLEKVEEIRAGRAAAAEREAASAEAPGEAALMNAETKRGQA